MQYFGGKARIAKEIVNVLNRYRKQDQTFVEPFCGGINITCLMGDNVIANEIVGRSFYNMCRKTHSSL